MQISKVFFALLMFGMGMQSVKAQSEFGMITDLEAEKKLTDRLSVSLGTELRFRENMKALDRWTMGIGADYKLTKGLKVDAGYKLLNTNYREEITLKNSGAPNKWTPSYWGIRHRFYASLTGSYKFNGGLRISLRERWQYTYRPEKTISRWDYDDEQWEDKVRKSKGKHVLRSRLQVEYSPKGALFTPYANAELYNTLAIEKVRYTIGTNINISKHHALNVFYRYQDMRNVDDDDYEPDIHYLGIGYKFKF